MDQWVTFFDADHSIYVNARHREVHAGLIAAAIVRYIPGADSIVLDYGCGEALHATRVAEAAGKLILCEAGPNLLAALGRRFAANARIAVCSREQVAELADRSIDLIVLNSVAQYLTPGETDALFMLFHRLLKPGGLVVVGDIVPPDNPPYAEVAALLRLAAANGFLLAAAGGLVRTLFSDYVRLRSRLKLTRYRAEDMIAKLGRAGFSARRAGENLGHDRRRMTFLARPA